MLALRAERLGELQVAPGLSLPAELLERAAEPIVRVVVGRREVEHRAELGLRLGIAPRAEVRDAERLADRRLVRLALLRLLERARSLGGHALLELGPAFLEEVVGLTHAIQDT